MTYNEDGFKQRLITQAELETMQVLREDAFNCGDMVGYYAMDAAICAMLRHSPDQSQVRRGAVRCLNAIEEAEINEC